MAGADVGRRITRTEYDGTIAVLIDRFDGKRLNGPNDVVMKSDDSIWFTDPPSGISGDYLGVDARQNVLDVYRLDPTSGMLGRDHRPSQAAEWTRLFTRRVEALCHRECT